MRYTVALTGGIGSGKSTVANAFADLGINVIDADIIARQVVEPGRPALRAIAEHFGADMIAADGTLQRRALRERIFANPEEKNWLNALLHPLIQQETQHQIQQATSPYVLWVVPLLVENSLYKKRIVCWWWMSAQKRNLSAPCSAMMLLANMSNKFLLPVQRAKPALPWQMTSLIITAHRMLLHRMLPACTQITCSLRRSLSHRKNLNTDPRSFLNIH